MTIRKKAIKSNAKAQKTTGKKIQGKPLVSTKAVSLKEVAYFPPNPC
jgi:hypothetical protein